MLPEEAVHSSGGLLWVAGHCLDIDLEVPFQELVHLPVVIVVIPRGKDPNISLTLGSRASSSPLVPPYESRNREGGEKAEGRLSLLLSGTLPLPFSLLRFEGPSFASVTCFLSLCSPADSILLPL